MTRTEGLVRMISNSFLDKLFGSTEFVSSTSKLRKSYSELDSLSLDVSSWLFDFQFDFVH